MTTAKAKKRAAKVPRGLPVLRGVTVIEQVDLFEDAIFRSKLPARARLVLLAMLHYSIPADGAFHCDSARSTIAGHTGLSPRSIARELDTFDREGWITRVDDEHELRIPGGTG